MALLGVRKALVLCTARQRALAQQVSEVLDQDCAGIYDQAVMHVPVTTVHDALAVVRNLQADSMIAIGGGSTIGLAKALAAITTLPILAVPTTYSGSEMTSVYGITKDGAKHTIKDPRVLPRTVIYDPSLTLRLPIDISVVSGMNAIAHSAEGLYAKDGNPVVALMAEEGIRAMADGLRALNRQADSLKARSDCLYGAWLSGMVLGNAGMALHHKLCHVLGGSFNLPHAQTHSVMLPHSLAYNAAAAVPAMQRISRALGRDQEAAPTALYRLAQELGAPLALQEIGMKETDLDLAADIALSKPYWNPCALEYEGVRALLQDAFQGRPPHFGTI
ncbi:iron-containing alcohol dehydrogenase [Pusillimonas sp. T7-7]|nr:iron-containing alcohol dehydrogenase [Pusillimonas sp. T7-7]